MCVNIKSKSYFKEFQNSLPVAQALIIHSSSSKLDHSFIHLQEPFYLGKGHGGSRAYPRNAVCEVVLHSVEDVSPSPWIIHMLVILKSHDH